MATTPGKEIETPRTPKTDPQAEKALLDAMPLEEKVVYHYEHGQGSIQDIARVYRLDVAEVLHMIGQDELGTVTTQGDLVDANEAGPGAQLNYYGKDHNIGYSTN
jgi:hypothetical protein